MPANSKTDPKSDKKETPAMLMLMQNYEYPSSRVAPQKKRLRCTKLPK